MRKRSPATLDTDIVSRRAVTVSAMFGITAPRRSEPAAAQHDYQHAAAQLCSDLLPGRIALIEGPSGSGKSSILRAVSRLVASGPSHQKTKTVLIDSLTARSLIALTGYRDAPSRSIVDLFRCSLEQALALLARVGLAEASLFSRPFTSLSDGQKHRLFLALTLAAARPGSTILIDEFGSILDRLSARAISESIRKWFCTLIPEVAAPRLIVATAHDDLADHLSPDLHMHVPLGPNAGTPIRIQKQQTDQISQPKHSATR